MEARHIDDDEVLTHLGSGATLIEGRPFKNRPSPRQEDFGVSLLLGEMSAEDGAEIVWQIPPPVLARYTTAGRLRAAGFIVEHTPYNPHNPYHVSVRCNGEWDTGRQHEFDACFA